MTEIKEIKDLAKETVKVSPLKIEERNLLVSTKKIDEAYKKKVLDSTLNLETTDGKKADFVVSDIIKAINTLMPANDTLLKSNQRVFKLATSSLTINGKTIKIGQFGAKSENVAYLQLGIGADPDGYRGKGTSDNAAALGIAGTVNTSTTPDVIKNDSGIDKTKITAEKGKIILTNIKDIDLKNYTDKNPTYKFWFDLATKKGIFGENYEIKNISVNAETKEIIVRSSLSGSSGKEYKISIGGFIKDAQTGTIDTDKFVKLFNEKIIKQILVAEYTDTKDKNYNTYLNNYNSLVSSKAVDLTKNLSTGYSTNTENNKKALTILADTIKKDVNIGIDTRNTTYKDSRAEKLVNDITARVKLLEARLKYLKMKATDETKVSGFEKFLNEKTPKTVKEKLESDNAISLKKGEYKTFRDDFNSKGVAKYLKVSYTDRANFDARLNKIDKLYGYGK